MNYGDGSFFLANSMHLLVRMVDSLSCNADYACYVVKRFEQCILNVSHLHRVIDILTFVAEHYFTNVDAFCQLYGLLSHVWSNKRENSLVDLLECCGMIVEACSLGAMSRIVLCYALYVLAQERANLM